MAAWVLPAQPPTVGSGAERPPVRRAIADGLSFVARTRALAGSFVVDINAMTFGMPRALFAVLALTVYHAGAGGTGLLYAAIAVGGTISVLTSGWVVSVRRLGSGWCSSACCSGGWRSSWAGLVRSASGRRRSCWRLAGWADGISAVGALDDQPEPDARSTCAGG